MVDIRELIEGKLQILIKVERETWLGFYFVKNKLSGRIQDVIYRGVRREVLMEIGFFEEVGVVRTLGIRVRVGGYSRESLD